MLHHNLAGMHLLLLGYVDGQSHSPFPTRTNDTQRFVGQWHFPHNHKAQESRPWKASQCEAQATNRLTCFKKANPVNCSATHLSFVFSSGLSHQRSMIDKAKFRCVPLRLQCSEECLLSTQYLNR